MAENVTIELEENEILRISIRKQDSVEQPYICECVADGPTEIMRDTLRQICAEQFDMICIPKAVGSTQVVISREEIPDSDKQWLQSRPTLYAGLQHLFNI